jgi:hypothetical protein
MGYYEFTPTKQEQGQTEANLWINLLGWVWPIPLCHAAYSFNLQSHITWMQVVCMDLLIAMV